MKFLLAILTFAFLPGGAGARQTVYTGSTPADTTVREFLDISRTDSIDFIRWKLVLNGDRYDLNCSYGLSKPNTNGFINEKKAAFAGKLKKQNHLFELQHKNGVFFITEINGNLIHLLDKNRNLLKGNGGWSYTLNNRSPAASNQYFYTTSNKKNEQVMVFEGRTPCEPLSKQIGRGSAQCYKLKWLLVLHTDANGKPTHYQAKGTALKEGKGNWDIITGKDGRTIYRLDPEKKDQATHLLTADNTILLFTSPEGSPLVGNEDFSFTLSRTVDREKR